MRDRVAFAATAEVALAAGWRYAVVAGWRAAQAHQSKEDSQRDNAAAPCYYADGALDLATTRKTVAEFGKPVLLLAGEYDVGLPPRKPPCMPVSSSMPSWRVQPGAGHFVRGERAY
jgi:pimeloyl-ACP methyl ester carboxylesterase